MRQARHAPAPLTALTAAALGTLQTVALLRRLRTELTTTGRLSTPSVIWMDATYAVHATAVAIALTRRLGHLPLPAPSPWPAVWPRSQEQGWPSRG